MPKIKVGDISMYYEIHGEGNPLVLINGAGAGVEMAQRRVLTFSREYRLVLFDNRGAGRSDSPDMTYTTGLLADDLAALLDAIGIDSAHIYGTSMGGMVAQEFALRHPTRVRSLILAVTHCGGPHHIPSLPSDTPDMENLSQEQASEALLKWFVTEAFIQKKPGIFRQLAAFSLAHPIVRDSFLKHSQAIASHDTYDRLPQILAPTLIIAGDADRVVPIQNARILSERIHNAELVILENTGHMLIEKADQVDSAILDFLKRHQDIGAGKLPGDTTGTLAFGDGHNDGSKAN